MTVRDIVRDIYGRLDVDSIDKSDIFYKDIVGELNNSIRRQIPKFVYNGNAERFSVTEDVYFSLQDISYPYLFYTQVNSLIQSLPPDKAILGANVYKVSESVKNSVASYAKNKVLRKADKVYKVTHDVTDLNVFNSIFDPKHIKTYRSNNELKYFTGDIIRDYDTGFFWKVTSDFKEIGTETVLVDEAEIPFLETVAERVYLKLIDKDAYSTPTFHPFKHIDNLKLFNDINGYYGFTYNGNKLYVTKNIKRMSITYVKDWEDVIEPEDEVIIPDSCLEQAKNEVTQMLLPKIKDMQQDVGIQNG